MRAPFYDTGWYALERDLITVTERITEAGFPMHRGRAQALLAELQDTEGQMAEALQTALPPIDVTEDFYPKRSNKTKGYVAGQLFVKHKLVPFNPNSGQQFYDRMVALHGTWPSTVLTGSGNPSVTAAVLATLPWPEAEKLLHLKIASKRIGMLAGDNGYLTLLGDDDRLHTTYHTLGAITGRASHQPNVAQCPAVLKQKVPQPDGSAIEEPLHGAAGHWGFEFRNCFTAPDGWMLVGVDLVGLEARVLASYIANYDGGAYALLVTGGVDLHALNQQNTGAGSRAAAKRLLYATIYGCGNRKAGTIIDPDETDEHILEAIGKLAKDSLIGGIQGFGELFAWLDGLNSDELPGLDGRIIYARKKHARLNTLIQSSGAVLAKRWLVLADRALQHAGLRWDLDYQIVGWIHDELVIACRPDVADLVAELAKLTAIGAGEFYDLQCPLAADAHIGATWATIH